MQRNLSAALMALILGIGAFPALADAPAAPNGAYVENSTPLVVIRFIRPNILFARALKEAVNQALGVKPDAAFDVVLKPAAKGSPGDEGSHESVKQVVAVLQRAGIPAARIRTAHLPSEGAPYDEVDVFVH